MDHCVAPCKYKIRFLISRFFKYLYFFSLSWDFRIPFTEQIFRKECSIYISMIIVKWRQSLSIIFSDTLFIKLHFYMHWTHGQKYGLFCCIKWWYSLVSVSIRTVNIYCLFLKHFWLCFLLFDRISPYPAMLHKYASESKWNDAIRLCRFVKVRLI